MYSSQRVRILRMGRTTYTISNLNKNNSNQIVHSENVQNEQLAADANSVFTSLWRTRVISKGIQMGFLALCHMLVP